MPQKEKKTMAKIITISNQKGGVGKTTTAINMSACIADKGRRVLVIDLDPQGNATTGIGIDKNQLSSNVYDVLLEGKSVAQSVVKTSVKNLDILPCNNDLVGAEIPGEASALGDVAALHHFTFLPAASKSSNASLSLPARSRCS